MKITIGTIQTSHIIGLDESPSKREVVEKISVKFKQIRA
jgi:hypothetical protein